MSTAATTSLLFMAGFAGAVALTPLVRKLACQVGAFDMPDGRRKTHKTPVPLFGGVAVWLVFVGGCLAVALCSGAMRDRTRDIAALLTSASLMCFVGCWDDLRGLRAVPKLCGQMLAVAPLAFSEFRIERIAIDSYTLELGYAAAPLTMLWILGGVNAINLLDGADGLASLVGIVLSAAAAAIFAIHGDALGLMMAMPFAGALLGFLVYNAPPARIYLGDAGSMLIGLVVSVFSLHAGVTTNRTLSPAIPFALLAVPAFDAVLAIVRRSLNGQPVWQADRGHIHHRLLGRGMTAWQTSLSLALVTLATSSAGIASALWTRQLVSIVSVVFFFGGLVHSRYWGYEEWDALRNWVANRLKARWLPLVEANDAAPPSPNASEPEVSDTWMRLVASMVDHQVYRLEVWCGDGRDSGWRRDWGERRRGASAPPRVIETRQEAPTGAWCRIRALLAADAAMSRSRWQAIHDVLYQFSRHWAANPHSQPAHQLRIVGHDEESREPLAGDGESQAA